MKWIAAMLISALLIFSIFSSDHSENKLCNRTYVSENKLIYLLDTSTDIKKFISRDSKLKVYFDTVNNTLWWISYGKVHKKVISCREKIETSRGYDYGNVETNCNTMISKACKLQYQKMNMIKF